MFTANWRCETTTIRKQFPRKADALEWARIMAGTCKGDCVEVWNRDGKLVATVKKGGA